MSVTLSLILAIAASLGCLASVFFYLKAKGQARRLPYSLSAVFALFVAMALVPQGSPGVAMWLLGGSGLIALADLLLSLRKREAGDVPALLLIAEVVSAAGFLACANGLMVVYQPEWEGVLSLFLVGLIAALSYKKRKGIRPQHGLQIPVLLYLCTVLFMGSLGIALAVRNPSAGLILLGLGGVCFALSLNAQLAHSYGKKPACEQYLFARGTYFLAQLLLGWSILFL